MIIITAVESQDSGLWEVIGLDPDGNEMELPMGMSLQASHKLEANRMIILAATQLHDVGFDVKPERLVLSKEEMRQQLVGGRG